MEEILKKVINIDKEAIRLEDKTSQKVKEKQNSLTEWLRDIEIEESKKAEEKINKYIREIKRETEEQLKKLDEKEQNQLKEIENNYYKNKEMIINKALIKIIEG